MVTKKFKEPVYKTQVWLVWDCGPDEVEAWIRQRYGDDKIALSGFEGMCCAFTRHEVREYVIWLRNNASEAKLFYILCHELLHLIEWRFRDLGIEFQGESVAYYQEYWLRRIWRRLHKAISIKDSKNS